MVWCSCILPDDVPWPCFVGWLLGWFGFCNYARDEQIIIQGYRRGCYSCTQSGISFNEGGISFNASSMCSGVSYGLLTLNSMKHIFSCVLVRNHGSDILLLDNCWLLHWNICICHWTSVYLSDIVIALTWYFQMKSSLQLHLDGSTAVVEDIGRQVYGRYYVVPHDILDTHPLELIFLLFCQQLIYGRRIPIPELFARIDAVDPSTISRVANPFIFLLH